MRGRTRSIRPSFAGNDEIDGSLPPSRTANNEASGGGGEVLGPRVRVEVTEAGKEGLFGAYSFGDG